MCTDHNQHAELNVEQAKSRNAERQMAQRRRESVPTRAELDQKRRTMAQTRSQKACNTCGETKPLSEFYKDASKKNLDGHRYSCKICEAARQNARREAKGVVLRGKNWLHPSSSPLDAQISKSLEYARKRSRERGNTCDLDAEFLLDMLRKHPRCAVTNRAFDLSPPSDGAHFNRDRFSIDRIDSSRGYTKDNVQLVTVAANMAKNTMSNEQLVDLAVDITRHAGYDVVTRKRTLH